MVSDIAKYARERHRILSQREHEVNTTAKMKKGMRMFIYLHAWGLEAEADIASWPLGQVLLSLQFENFKDLW